MARDFFTREEAKFARVCAGAVAVMQSGEVRDGELLLSYVIWPTAKMDAMFERHLDEITDERPWEWECGYDSAPRQATLDEILEAKGRAA